MILFGLSTSICLICLEPINQSQMKNKTPFTLVDQDMDTTDQRSYKVPTRSRGRLSTVAIALGLTLGAASLTTGCLNRTDATDCDSDTGQYDSDSFDSGSSGDTTCD